MSACPSKYSFQNCSVLTCKSFQCLPPDFLKGSGPFSYKNERTFQIIEESIFNTVTISPLPYLFAQRGAWGSENEGLSMGGRERKQRGGGMSGGEAVMTNGKARRVVGSIWGRSLSCCSSGRESQQLCTGPRAQAEWGTLLTQLPPTSLELLDSNTHIGLPIYPASLGLVMTHQPRFRFRGKLLDYQLLWRSIWFVWQEQYKGALFSAI